jgi:hypothetical protein
VETDHPTPLEWAGIDDALTPERVQEIDAALGLHDLEGPAGPATHHVGART